MSPKSLVIPSSSLLATCLPASLSRYSTSNTWRGISLPLLSWLQSLKVSPSSQSCLVWQNPNSEQQGANSGQPSDQLTAAALYGGAAQLPGPVPAPSRPAQWGRLWRTSSTTWATLGIKVNSRVTKLSIRYYMNMLNIYTTTTPILLYPYPRVSASRIHLHGRVRTES